MSVIDCISGEARWGEDGHLLGPRHLSLPERIAFSLAWSAEFSPPVVCLRDAAPLPTHTFLGVTATKTKKQTK